MKPLELVEAQLEAYNARDIDRFCAVFSPQVVCYSLKDNKVLLEGMEAFRRNYQSLFADSPELHVRILNRMELGDFVIDHEEVSGRRGQTVKAIAVYKITGDRISHVWFAL